MKKYDLKKDMKKLFSLGYNLVIFGSLILILAIILTVYLFSANFLQWDAAGILEFIVLIVVLISFFVCHIVLATEIINTLKFENKSVKRFDDNEISKIKKKIWIPFIGFFMTKKAVFSNI